MVYVLDKNSKPIMPCKEAKARHLLKAKKAVIVRRTPFTIRLKFEVDGNIQPVTLGMDPGARYIGISASTEDKVLFEGKVTLRYDIKDRLNARREARHKRRHRLKHRPERFSNRGANMRKGNYPPSTLARIDTHINIVKFVKSILPISEIRVEFADFDIRKIEDPNISNEDYQKGNLLGFYNVRSFVLNRDNHTCALCHKDQTALNKSSHHEKLEVHHIVPRQNGGSNKPSNLITLCHECHRKVHDKNLVVAPIDKSNFNAIAFMMMARKIIISRLRALYGPEMIKKTYGYITKATRDAFDLMKEHYIDARCIAGHPEALPCDTIYMIMKHRCHNRKMFKDTIFKKGIKKKSQSADVIKGFRLWDKVEFEGKTGYIAGKRTSGFFSIRTIEGKNIHTCANSRDLVLLEKRRYMSFSPCRYPFDR